MRVCAGITLRVAGGEVIEAPPLAESCIITPRSGEPVEVDVVEGSITLPAALEIPNLLTLSWDDGTVTEAELVSYHYFPISALSGYGDGRDEFDTLPTGVLEAARQAATEIIEVNSGRSFVKRLGSTTDWGGDRFLYADHNDISDVEGPYRQVSGNQIVRTGHARFPHEVRYTYGTGLPGPVAAACLDLAAYMLRPSNRPTGATGESSDAGYIHFTLAGRDGATDIPEVNAIIEQFGAGRRYVW